MPVNTQHKLLEYEIPPPKGTWEFISQRLDREFDCIDSKLSNKLFDTVLDPPINQWHSILSELEKENEPEKKAKRIDFNWKRLAAAAIITGVIITSVLFFLKNFSAADKKENLAAENKSLDKKSETNDQPVKKAIDGFVKDDNTPKKENQFPIKERIVSIVAKTQVPLYEVDYNEPSFKAVALQSFQVVDATDEASIVAPVIRDADGKIIMDMSLLTSQANNYITVTGPNGQQTRISSKFANFLPSLNNSNIVEKEEYLDLLIRQSMSWKKRFEEWRAKILQQGNFSPSCATFFDILELRELIKD
ncbi:MAG: hypothetical protein ACKVOW_13665 [Chitinophagaceae bacterium]